MLTALFFLLPSFKVYAGEIASYKIQWEYYIGNTSDEAVTQVTFGFAPGQYANNSSCQPDANFSLRMTLSPYEDYGFMKLYQTDLQANETKQIISMTWTFNGGDFDQRLYAPALRKQVSVEPFYGDNRLVELTSKLTEGLSGNCSKAFAIYKWITQNITYGKKQNYALPEKANCQTYASLFSSMCRIAEIPCREVYGYAVKIVDGDGELTYGTIDASTYDMHVWNEFYDEISGWAIADATFDTGKSEFEFFMQGNEQTPHLAMFYDTMPILMASTGNGGEHTVWSKKITITRSEFKGKYSQDKNALAAYCRIEAENKELEQFFAEQGTSFQINRLTDELSWSGNALNIPSKYKVIIRKPDIIEISYNEKLLLRWQFGKNGAWRLLCTPD